MYNGNENPVRIAHARALWKHEATKEIKQSTGYWNGRYVCIDLKVVDIVLGLQLMYTKFCCFLCEWDTGDRRGHCIKSNDQEEATLLRLKKNIYETFVNSE